MAITQIHIHAPQLNTERAQSVYLSYSEVSDRLAYPSNNSVVIRPVDPKSTIPVRQFTKHTHATTVASFSPSGNYIASGDVSGQVKIWDATPTDSFDQPSIKSEFQILSGLIKSIVFDGDSTRVIAVGDGKDKFGHCFTYDSGNSIGEIQGHSSTVLTADIKQQRPYRAATAGNDKSLVFYKGPPFKFDRSLKNYHSNTIRQVKFSPDGKYLVSVGSDRSIIIYDGLSGDFINKIENGHNGGIFAISWFKNSTEFITASADKTLKQWNVESLSSVGTYTIDTDVKSIENQQLGVVVTKDYIVSISFNGNLNYFKPGNFDSKPVEIISGHQNGLTNIKFIENSIFTGGSDGKIFKWNLAPDLKIDTIGKQLGDSSTSHTNLIVKSIQFNDQLITVGWDDKLKIWDNDNQLNNSLDLSGQPKQLLASNDQLIVLFENELRIFDNKLAEVNKLEFKFNATSADLIPNSDKVLILNGTNNIVHEYSIESGSITESSIKYQPLRSQPTIVNVSPDGKYAAVADTTGKYSLYDTSKATVVSSRWAFHTSRVYDGKWTQDSKFLISVGLDNTIFVYSVTKPSKVLKYPNSHQNGISGVELIDYDEKSAKIVTIGLDGFIKTWSIDLSAYQ